MPGRATILKSLLSSDDGYKNKRRATRVENVIDAGISFQVRQYVHDIYSLTIDNNVLSPPIDAR